MKCDTNYTLITIEKCITIALESTMSLKGQVRSECLTCTFRASCCSARLSWTQVPAFAGFSLRDRVFATDIVIIIIIAGVITIVVATREYSLMAYIDKY